MEDEGRSPSPLPSPPSEASNSLRDRILQEAAAQSAADLHPDVDPDASTDRCLQETTAPLSVCPHPDADAQSAADPSPDIDAASQAAQDRGLQETTAPSADDPPHDADASSQTLQDLGLQETTDASAANFLSDDLRDQIVRQVEYYFSDANLPTDKFLLKYVKRDKAGFVPIAVIGSFRKMKKLVTDLSQIVAALRTSSQLVVSLSGKKVRRLHPLPVTDIKDAKSHTVLVENLPEDCSTDCIRRIFGNIGNILNITIRDPHSIEESAVTRKAEMAISRKLHALVEYETIEAAENAVATLNDLKNWSGLRVELLLKRMEKYGLIQKGHKENSEKNIMQASDTGANGQKLKSAGLHEEIAETEGGRRNRYIGRGRAHLQQNANGHGTGHGGYIPSSCSSNEGGSKPIPGPRMPDGTRGFTMGRGKPDILKEG